MQVSSNSETMSQATVEKMTLNKLNLNACGTFKYKHLVQSSREYPEIQLQIWDSSEYWQPWRYKVKLMQSYVELKGKRILGIILSNTSIMKPMI